MKKNENILKHLRISEKKHGVQYAKVGGLLYKWVHIVFLISAAVTLLLNIIIISGQLILTNERGGEILPIFVWLIASTVIFFLSVVLSFWYKHIFMQFVTSFLGTVSAVIIGVVFAIVLNNAKGPDNISVHGLNGRYYLHAIFLLTVIGCLIWSVIIIIREKIKTNNAYKIMVERIYMQYGKLSSDMTDAEFNEFLSNYDPKYENIRKKRKKQGYDEYDGILKDKDIDE